MDLDSNKYNGLSLLDFQFFAKVKKPVVEGLCPEAIESEEYSQSLTVNTENVLLHSKPLIIAFFSKV